VPVALLVAAGAAGSNSPHDFSMLMPPRAAQLPLKGVVAVVIGNWLEFYDFLVFTFFAVMIGEAFFPAQSAIGRLLGALATFGVGFFTRPLGAAVIGAYADRVGRRAALTLTLILMAVGSAIVGLTPSYAQIGIAAPIILVVARLIQGFSCGGEVGPATTYLLESASVERRAALTAWQGYSQQLAVLLGSLVGVILSATLSREQLYAWGWRVPFILGAFIAPVGLYIRRQLPETIDHSEVHHSLTRHCPDCADHLRRHDFDVRVHLHGDLRHYHPAFFADRRDNAHADRKRGGNRRDGARRVGRSLRTQADARALARAVRDVCLSGVSSVDVASSDAHRGRRREHVRQLRLLDRVRRCLRFRVRGVSKIGPFDRARDSVCLGCHHLRRNNAVRGGMAD
jgi:predicted MFS family arabinose efflux permease